MATDSPAARNPPACRPVSDGELQAWAGSRGTERQQGSFPSTKLLKLVSKKPWQQRNGPRMPIMAKERKRPVLEELSNVNRLLKTSFWKISQIWVCGLEQWKRWGTGAGFSHWNANSYKMQWNSRKSMGHPLGTCWQTSVSPSFKSQRHSGKHWDTLTGHFVFPRYLRRVSCFSSLA